VSSPEEKFDEIVQDALTKMTLVKCDVETYEAGLRAAIGEFEVSLQASKESH
jgi:hypothetical protein